jgi:hypothetical protein
VIRTITAGDAQFLQAALILTTEANNVVHSSVPIRNLSIENLTLKNTGNADIAEFRFGMTLQGDNQAIKVETRGRDRHHEASLIQNLSLEEPQDKLDFILKPFNREDEYRFIVHFIYKKSAKAIILSSPHSTQLVEGKETVRSKLVEVGGYSLIALGVLVGIFALFSLILFVSPSSSRRLEERRMQEQLNELTKKVEELKLQIAAPSSTSPDKH